MKNFLPCPCCNNLTFNEIGEYEICPICGWEDDPIQSQELDYAGGANICSLIQARENWMRLNK